MHKGTFKGANLSDNKKILILGESHHHGDGNTIDYTTEKVVKDYFKHPDYKCYKFFDKIALCFGFLLQERELFWSKVWFGNYVDESNCGIRTNRANNLIEKNKRKYNKELFKFINENNIDTVFCFSRLVYNNLPPRAFFENQAETYYVQDTGGKKDFINKFIYKPGKPSDRDFELFREVTVYGFRHPSARCGFCSEHYADYLKNEFNL